MKKIAIIAILAMAMLLGVIGCGGDKATVTSIVVTRNPKVEYELNEEFDPTGGEITVSWSDKKTQIIDMDAEGVTIDGFDSTTLGNDIEVKVTYKGQTATLKVSVIGVNTIAVSAMPRLQYNMGDSFDPSVGKLLVSKTNGGTEVINMTDSAVQITGFDSSVPGYNKPITITYKGKTATLNTHVIDNTIKSLAITEGAGAKTFYWTGESFQPSGFSIVVTKAAGGTETVELDNADSIIYDFQKRGGSNVPNKTVTVQYRGHQTTFDIQLDSKVTGISKKDDPQTKYVVNEKFYNGTGSLWLEYEDGENSIIMVSDPKISVIGFQQLATDGTFNIRFKHLDYTFETAEIQITVVKNAASDVLALYNQLEGIQMDWLEATISDFTPAQATTAADMYSAYVALTPSEKNDLRNYASRIIGLAYGTKYMEAYSTAKVVAASDLKNYTQTTVEDYKVLLQEYDNYIELNRADIISYQTYDTTVLYRSGTTTVILRDVRQMLTNVQGSAQKLISDISKLNELLIGFDRLPDTIPYGYDFTQSKHANIYTAYESLLEISQLESEIYLPILDVWHEGYLDIMLEYAFQKDNKTIGAYTVALLEDGFLMPSTLYDVVNDSYIYQVIADSYFQVEVYLPAIILSENIANALDKLYLNVYDSQIAVYEQYEFFDYGEVKYTAKYFVDQIFNSHRVIMFNQVSQNHIPYGGLLNPQGELKEFYEMYFDVILTYILYNGDGVYLPSNEEFDANIQRLREGLYNLDTNEKIELLTYFEEGFMFGFIGDYMKSYLGEGTVEYQLYNTYISFFYSYVNYALNINDEAEEPTQRNILDNAISDMEIGLNNISNKTKIDQYMSYEIAYFYEVKEWFEMAINPSSLTEKVLEINVAIELAYSFYNNGYMDYFAATYRSLVEMVDELNSTEREIYQSYGLGSFDGPTHEYYVDYLGSIYNSFFTINSESSQGLRDAFEIYMDILYKAENDMLVNEEANYQYVGKAEYYQDISLFKNKFFALDYSELLVFMSSGTYMSNTYVFSLLSDYFTTIISNENAQDTYAYLIDIVYFAVAYDMGLVASDVLNESIIYYKDQYDKLNSTTKGQFNTAAQVELQYVEQIYTFNDSIQANEQKFLDLIGLATTALSYLNDYSTDPILFHAAYRRLAREYEALTTNEKEVIDLIPVFKETELNFGELFALLTARGDLNLLVAISDDNAVLDLYYKLADMVDMYSDELFMYGMEGNYTLSQAFVDGCQQMLDAYRALSAFQQTSFLLAQQYAVADEQYGVVYYDWFMDFIAVYVLDSGSFSNQQKQSDTMISVIYSTLDALQAFNVYHYGLLNSSQMLTYFEAAKQKYDALTQNEKTAFDASRIASIYNNTQSIYDTYATAMNYDKSYNVVIAMDYLIKAIEASKLQANDGDFALMIHYLYVFESQLLTMQSAQYTTMMGYRYESKTLQAWLETMEQLLGGIQGMTSIRYFYLRFDYVAGKYFDAYNTVDLSLFSASYYEGDALADILILEDLFLNSLTAADQQLFLANFGYTYRLLLRHAHANTDSADEFMTWYYNYVETFVFAD